MDKYLGNGNGMANVNGVNIVPFADRVIAAQKRSGGHLVLNLVPRLLQMPLPIARYDDPFLPFSKAIIAATHDIVCGYVFDFAAYLTTAGAGAIALERAIAYARGFGDVITILHAPFASVDYAFSMSDNAFNVDAVTVTDEEFLAPYVANPATGAFVVRRGENPVIVPLQGNAGVYWQDAETFTMLSPDAQALQLNVAGEKTLYAGRGDDFAERVREALLS